jgi:hypothetical protein
MLDNAKLEALNCELSDMRDQSERAESDLVAALDHCKRECEDSHRKVINALKIEHEESRNSAVALARTQALKDVSQTVDVSVEALRKSYEVNQTELKQELGTTKQSCEEYKSRVSALDKEVAHLKLKLVSERQRGASLEQELSAVASTTNIRVSDVEKSYARELKRLDNELSLTTADKLALDDKLYSANVVIAELKAQVHGEQMEKLSIRNNYEAMGDEYNMLSSQLKKSLEDCVSAQRDVEEWSKKYSLCAENHQLELNRVHKRNQVLADTVSKLTAQSQYEGPVVGSDLTRARTDLLLDCAVTVPIDVRASQDGDKWVRTPPSSAHNKRLAHYQRGQSAPALLINSIDKQRPPNAGDINDDDYGIQVIDTHRDGDALQRIQMRLYEYQNSLGSSTEILNHSISSAGESSSVTKARARTAPPVRSTGITENTWKDEDERGGISDGTEEATPVLFPESDWTSNGYRPSISPRVSGSNPTGTVNNAAIDRIQSAINQRRVQLQSRQRTTKSSRAHADDYRGTLELASDVSATSPSKTLRLRDLNLGNTTKTPARDDMDGKGLSADPLSNSFSRKLRSTIEEGEQHWIPFSPQPRGRQSDIVAEKDT